MEAYYSNQASHSMQHFPDITDKEAAALGLVALGIGSCSAIRTQISLACSEKG